MIKDDLIKEYRFLRDKVKKPRKPRSDKGKPRKNYTKSQDKYTQSALAIYNRVYARLNKNDKVLTDDNGYYLSIDSKRDFVHNTMTQRPVDLEQYRFNAWKEEALTNPTAKIPSNYAPVIRWISESSGLLMREVLRLYNNKDYDWQTLFSEFYHIPVQEISAWDYEYWRECYERTPKEELPFDFYFSLVALPGTQSFCPEWSYVQEQREEQQEQQEQDNINKKSYAGSLSKRR